MAILYFALYLTEMFLKGQHHAVMFPNGPRIDKLHRLDVNTICIFTIDKLNLFDNRNDALFWYKKEPSNS